MPSSFAGIELKTIQIQSLRVDANRAFLVGKSFKINRLQFDAIPIKAWPPSKAAYSSC